MQNLYAKAITETYDREMQVMIDKQLFIQVDEDKNGRLNYNEFKKLMDIRSDMMTQELGE